MVTAKNPILSIQTSKSEKNVAVSIKDCGTGLSTSLKINYLNLIAKLKKKGAD